MLNALKKVVTFFFHIISRIFIILIRSNNITLYTKQQKLKVVEEKLHIIIGKIVTSSKKIKTVNLRRKAPLLSHLVGGETLRSRKTVMMKHITHYF